MKKRKEKTLQEKKLFSNKQLTIILSGLAAIIVFGFLISSFLLQTPEAKFSLKAAIIDQLGEEISNPEFNETGVVASILKNAGFNVSYHRSETIDVTFYKGLAKYNYGIIILRSHAAMRENETTIDFFTSEEFRADKYVSQQNNGLLTKGNYSWKPEKFYFAITPKFIENLEGTFPKSIVIAMGCWTLKPECNQMAKAFKNKGATVYIGWTKKVDADHTDRETVSLLRNLLEHNKTVADAVARVTADWQYSSKMSFYPESAGSLTISRLITEVMDSSDTQSAITLFEPSLAVCICKATPKIRKILNLACV